MAEALPDDELLPPCSHRIAHWISSARLLFLFGHYQNLALGYFFVFPLFFVTDNTAYPPFFLLISFCCGKRLSC